MYRHVFSYDNKQFHTRVYVLDNSVFYGTSRDEKHDCFHSRFVDCFFNGIEYRYAFNFLAALKESDDPVSLGESFFPSNVMKRASRVDLLGRFGPDFADGVRDLKPGSGWHGPIESTRGTHYVRILEAHEPELAPFEALESYLRQDWFMTRHRETQQKKIDAMRKQYRIEIESDEG